MLRLYQHLFLWGVRALRKSHKLASTAGAKCVLAGMGVPYGKGLEAVGLPYISKWPGSTITLGTNCILVSAAYANRAGLPHGVQLSTARPGACLHIGNDVGLGGTSITAAIEVRIGNEVLFGPGVRVTDTDFHPIHPYRRRFNNKQADVRARPVHIEDNVWIGAGCLILKGVTIGRDSVIAAGSVVTKSIPPGVVAGGNPARVLRYLPMEDSSEIAKPHISAPPS